ncbi:pentapeptide repeat-containing protein [Jatrophihabitans endophyticus]|nr:pentapeptide repeat-containing protein [Jatrophihabitans endophyticus]
MASRRDRRIVPTRPDLPAELADAGADLAGVRSWDGLRADASLLLPERVHDLDMVECVWQDVDATSRRFDGLVCRDVVFEGCDLAGAVLDGARLTRVRFVDCRLTGTDFGGAALEDVVIERGVATLASFRGAQSSCLWVCDTSLAEADFSSARLRRSALLDCELTGVDFTGADVEGLHLHGSSLDSLRGAGALAGAAVRVEAEQLVPLGVALLTAMGVEVAERPTAP